MTDAKTICHDVDLLGDWLDAKGYTEEAGLCLRVLGLIHEQAEEIEKTKRFYIEAGFELRQLREQNRSLMDRKNKLVSDYRRLDNFDNNLFIIGQRLRFDADQIDALRREVAKSKKDAELKGSGDE